MSEGLKLSNLLFKRVVGASLRQNSFVELQGQFSSQMGIWQLIPHRPKR